MNFRYCLSFLLVLIAAPVIAVEYDPIATQNRNALVRLNGLPMPERAELLATGATSHAIGIELTSQFVSETTATESLLLDGETTALNYEWRYGINEKLELGISLPLISQGGGFLDGFVDSWHNTFNLPDGERDTQPKNQLLYRLQNGQQTLVFRDANTGVGDIALQLRTPLYRTNTQTLSGFTRLELPTGKADKFTGSGSTDIAVGANYSNSECFGRSVCHASLGVLWFGGADIYTSASRSSAVFGTATVAMPVWRSVVAKLQLETHQAMYDSNIKAIGEQAFQLSFGVALPLAKHWAIDLAMSEDISPTTAPDFSFVMGLVYRP